MLDKLFEVASYSELQSTIRFGEILIAATLAFYLASRIALLVVSKVNVKDDKEWVAEPARFDLSLTAQPGIGTGHKFAPENLFGDEIKRMLHQRNNAAKSR